MVAPMRVQLALEVARLVELGRWVEGRAEGVLGGLPLESDTPRSHNPRVRAVGDPGQGRRGSGHQVEPFPQGQGEFK